MGEVAINVRLKGDIARLVNNMLRRGYSESKEDLVRNSIIFYAMKLGLISPKALHKEAMERIKASGIEYTDEEIREQLEEVENE